MWMQRYKAVNNASGDGRKSKGKEPHDKATAEQICGQEDALRGSLNFREKSKKVG